LLTVSHELRAELEARSQGGTFRPRLWLKTSKTSTDGWRVTIGSTVSPGLRMELWLDRYPLTERRRFYYGFYAAQPGNIKHLKSQLPSHLRPVRNLSDSDYKRVSSGVWLLGKRLRNSEFNKPIFERYKYRLSAFYGVYVPAENHTADSVRRMVNRAADFFSEVMWLLPVQSKLSDKVLAYPQLERSVVRKHLVRERSPSLAKACKRRDGFRCQVCKMTFAEVYGEKLGAEFAESHHLHPLSQKRANQKTCLKDLVTVCANCHRMLHLMRGQEHDLDELKRVMYAQRKKLKT